MKLNLKYQLMEVKEINEIVLNRMFELMNENYNRVTETSFVNDLKKKNWAGIISDENEDVQGFTTFAINPANSGTKNYNVLFSGDTIITHEYWGSQVLMKGWCRSVGSIIASDPGKKWFWYLLSKGHRTYMYLPLFFNEYYPAFEPKENHDSLKQIANEVSLKIFGKYWKEDEGVVRFDSSQGELKPEWANATFQKRNSNFITFFLEKNPGFYKGEELVCIAPISPTNLMRSAKDYILEGMAQPVHLA
jgi:hypothetical protein